MSDNQEKLSENDFKDPYEFGFETDIESDFAPKGLNEDVIRFISNKKNEQFNSTYQRKKSNYY